MRVIAKKTLRDFWEVHEQARAPLEAWHGEASRAEWKTPHDIRERYAHASILGNHRVVFNIAGNHYRLIVSVDYERQAMFVKFIGTHADYDRIDAETYDGYSSG